MLAGRPSYGFTLLSQWLTFRYKLSFILTFCILLRDESESRREWSCLVSTCAALSEFYLFSVVFMFSVKEETLKSVDLTRSLAVEALRLRLHLYQAAGEAVRGNFFNVEATAVFIHGQTVAYTAPPAICVFCSSANPAALILQHNQTHLC